MEYPGGVINLRTLSVLLELLWTIIFKFLEALFSTYISVVLILPICTIAGVINEIFRYVVSQRLKWNYEGRYELVRSAADSMWSIKKPGNSRNILLLAIFDDITDLKTYKYEFHQRVLNYKDAYGNCPYGKLRKIFTQAFGYCCWKMDENFCIDRHFRMLEPRDNKPFFTESDLLRILSEMTEDMSQEHPQWEQIILPFVYDKDLNFNGSGTNNDGSGGIMYTLKPGGKLRSAKIFRFHHAYMDQVSAMAMMKTCWMNKVEREEDNEGPQRDSVAISASDPCCSLLENAKELLYLIAFGPSRYIKSWMEESSCFSQFSLPQFSGRKIHSWSSPAIDIKLLNGIQHHTNCSVAEILTSALGGSLRFVSEKYCKKPEWLIFCDTFEDSVFLGLPCPIVPFPVDCPVNKIGMAGFLLNTEASASRLDRLHSVRETYRRKVTNSPTSQLHYLIQSFLGRFPSRVIQYFLVESGAPVVFHYNDMMTAVEELESNSTGINVMGNPVEEIAFWMPLVTCTGLNICVCQCSGHIRICGVGESSRVSALELDFILRQMNQEIIEMAAECGLDVNNSDFVTLEAH